MTDETQSEKVLVRSDVERVNEASARALAFLEAVDAGTLPPAPDVATEPDEPDAAGGHSPKTTFTIDDLQAVLRASSTAYSEVFADWSKKILTGWDESRLSGLAAVIEAEDKKMSGAPTWLSRSMAGLTVPERYPLVPQGGLEVRTWRDESSQCETVEVVEFGAVAPPRVVAQRTFTREEVVRLVDQDGRSTPVVVTVSNDDTGRTFDVTFTTGCHPVVIESTEPAW